MKKQLNLVSVLVTVSIFIFLSCSQNSKIGFAEINGTSIHYELKGSGTTLVFMHGYALDMRFWDNQFENLSSDYALLRYDFRGFGKSKVPDTIQSYSHHEDLKALLEYLNIDKVVLIGHSMGGYPAFRFAYDNPNIVEAVVLEEGHALITEIYNNSESNEVGKMFMNVFKIGKTEGIDKGKEALLDISVSKSALENPISSDVFKQMVMEYSGWHWQNKDPQVMPTKIDIEELSDFLIPVLLINGDLSHKGYHASIKQMHDQLPNSKRVILENSGHMLSLENPNQFNKELKEFLDENQIK